MGNWASTSGVPMLGYVRRAPGLLQVHHSTTRLWTETDALKTEHDHHQLAGDGRDYSKAADNKCREMHAAAVNLRAPQQRAD
jgi:hypothetical protein